jgi:hypothetical protein
MFVLYTLNGLCTWLGVKDDLDAALLSLFYLDANSKALIEGADSSLRSFVQRRQRNSTYPWSYPLLATVGAIIAFAIKVEYGHEKSVRCLADVSATDLLSEVVDGLGLSASAAAAGFTPSIAGEPTSGEPSACPEPYHIRSQSGACCFIYDTTSWAGVRGFWSSFLVGFATYYSVVSLVGRFMLQSGIHHDPHSTEGLLEVPPHPRLAWSVSGAVSSLCWSRDALVACESTGRVALYDPLTGVRTSTKKMLVSDGSLVSVPALAVSPDGAHVATYDAVSGTIAVWSVDDHLHRMGVHAHAGGDTPPGTPRGRNPLHSSMV